MYKKIKRIIYDTLRRSESWTKTDMVYLFKGNIWISIFKFTAAVSSLVLTIAFANLISKHSYGSYKYILSIASILGIFSLQGISQSYAQSVARGKEGGFLKALKTKLKWGLLGGLGGFGFALYYYIKGDTELALPFLIVSIFVPFIDNLNLYIPLFNGRKKFKKSNLYKIIVQMISFSSILIALVFTQNIFYVILSYYFSYTMTRLIFLLFVLKNNSPNDETEADTIKYGKHLSLMSVLNTIAGNIDKFLIWHFVGGVELAIYSFSIAPTKNISAWLKNLVSLSTPKISERSFKDLQKTLPKKAFKLTLSIIPIAILYIIIAPWFYKLVFPQYTASIFYSQIFVLTLFYFPWSFFNIALTSHNKTKELYKINTISSVLNIVLLLTILPFYGLPGMFFIIFVTKTFRMSYQAWLFFRAT